MSENNTNGNIRLDSNMNTEWNIKDNIRFDLKATSDVHDYRIEICKSCDELNSVKFCQQCGCFMPLKTWLKSSSCPLKKW